MGAPVPSSGDPETEDLMARIARLKAGISTLQEDNNGAAEEAKKRQDLMQRMEAASSRAAEAGEVSATRQGEGIIEESLENIRRGLEEASVRIQTEERREGEELEELESDTTRVKALMEQVEKEVSQVAHTEGHF